jgi:hypothetical protein
MAVDVTIDGFLKQKASSYSVTEDSTPIDPSDNSGGAGQFTFAIPEEVNSKALRNKIVSLADGTRGEVIGTSRGVSGDGVTATFTSDAALAALVSIRTATPYIGSLQGAVTYYLGLVGITTNIVFTDASFGTTAVVFSGWNAVVWDQMKKLTAAYRFEISQIAEQVVVRPLRQRVADTSRNISSAWTLDQSNLAQTVEIYYYNNTYQTAGLAYPLGGWNDKVAVNSGFAAGTTTSFDVALIPDSVTSHGASILTIQQPTCVAWVDSTYSASSVYSVTGNDGLIIPPAEWAAGGGKVTVAIKADTQTLTVTVVASADTKYAPYSLAMPSGPSDSYSSLRLVGAGVFYNKRLLTFSTGANANIAPTAVGVTIDDEFIDSYSDAVAAVVPAISRYATARQTLSVTARGVNRAGDNGSFAYPTIADVNTQFAGLTLAQVNTLQTGKTLSQFDAAEYALVRSNFVNQAFGNIGGARALDGGQLYRIRTATIAADTIQYGAEADVTAADMNAQYSGLTLGQVNALFIGEAIGGFNVRPLR